MFDRFSAIVVHGPALPDLLYSSLMLRSPVPPSVSHSMVFWVPVVNASFSIGVFSHIFSASGSGDFSGVEGVSFCGLGEGVFEGRVCVDVGVAAGAEKSGVVV